MTPKANLATTAALEHFTATLADVILSSEQAREMIGAPEIVDVFVWHALEESEHKAVAFDVYRHVGGSERTRRRMMNYTCVTFLGGMALQVAGAMLGDRETYRRGAVRASIGRLRQNPLFTKKVWRQLRDYNRHGFHPDDHDTTELLDAWRERLFGDDGTLNDRLLATA